MFALVQTYIFSKMRMFFSQLMEHAVNYLIEEASNSSLPRAQVAKSKSQLIRSPCTEVREPTGRGRGSPKKKTRATRDDGDDGCNRRGRGRQPYGLIQQRSPKIINL